MCWCRSYDGEIAALRLGFELGMTLVDTAEMYAEGGAEQLVGEAVRGRRDEGRARLVETLEAFSELVKMGKIRYWGVSNFDADDLAEVTGLPGGAALTTDQVLYNLTRRGIEYDLVPWCRRHRVPIMAYSPIEQGRMLAHPTLRAVAYQQNRTPAQVALAWLLRQDGLVVIPRAGSLAHVRENHAALGVRLTDADLAALDRAFPPPSGPQPLDML